MTTITFDTLAYAKRLRDAGVPEPQAEAQVAALAEALKQGAGELANRSDIDRLEARLNVIEERTAGRFHLLYWMVGFNLALTVAVLWKLIHP